MSKSEAFYTISYYKRAKKRARNNERGTKINDLGQKQPRPQPHRQLRLFFTPSPEMSVVFNGVVQLHCFH